MKINDKKETYGISVNNLPSCISVTVLSFCSILTLYD